MDKNIVYLGLEFVFGPIQKFQETKDGQLITGIKVIDTNEDVINLDKEINDLWCSLWSNDPESVSGMFFDEKREKELAPLLLEKINELIEKLNQINDGTYEIEDMISDHLKSLL